MLNPIKKITFNLNHWLLVQRANYYTAQADKAIANYKQARGLK